MTAMANPDLALDAFRNAAEQELLGRILPFWLEQAPDHLHGGFVGRRESDLRLVADAPKGLILNARMLWTFSAVHRVYPDERHRAMADRAFEALTRSFWDHEHGGAFWMVEASGGPADTKKKVYGQAFLVYALVEYGLATGAAEPLDRAESLWRLVDDRAHDPVHGGYFETFERDWSPAEDVRLSDVDLNERKSMNNHLHVLEALSALERARPSPPVRDRLQEVLRLFEERIVDRRSRHFRLFFDEAWNVRSDRISFGHDIEGSWLLCEAAEVLEGHPQRVAELAVAMAAAVLAEAVDPDGGLSYEADPSGIVDSDRHWWPQAEAAVGFLNAFELARDPRFLDASQQAFDYIQARIVDREHGEWHWRVARDGVPDRSQPKISQWKCPYHNGRMCLELIRRIDRLARPRASGSFPAR
jgi:mannobiose 2-epimerase